MQSVSPRVSTERRTMGLHRITLLAVPLCVAGAPGKADPVPPPKALIVLQGLIQPEIETVALTSTCFSRRFSFTIINRRNGPSTLTEARVDGKRSRYPESVELLQEFGARGRAIRVSSTLCIGRDEFQISLSGLLHAPVSGQKDDIRQSFRVRF